MGYREERDALRARAEGLEQELSAARTDLGQAQDALREAQGDTSPRARIAQLERDLAAAQRGLEALRAEIDGPRRPGSGRPALYVALAASVVLVSALAAVLLLARSAPPPPVVVAPAPPPAPAAPPRATRGGDVPPPEPEPPPLRGLEARWTGSVLRTSGAPLAPGAPCEVVAKLEGAGKGISVQDVTVTCGGAALYSTRDPLEGMSMRSGGATEARGDRAGTYRYGLAYDDTGARSGARAQISLRTESRTAAVWRDTVPAMRVEITLQPLSTPVQGGPLVPGPDDLERPF